MRLELGFREPKFLIGVKSKWAIFFGLAFTLLSALAEAQTRGTIPAQPRTISPQSPIDPTLPQSQLPQLVPLPADPGLEPRLIKEWSITPSIEVQQGFTDNARHERPSQQKSDFFAVVTPGVQIIHLGDRLNFNLDYAVSRYQYYDVESESSFRHNFREIGTLEILRDSVFFDLRSSVSRIDLTPAGEISALPSTDSSNQATVINVTASPYWRINFGGWVQSELRYGLQYTHFSRGGLQDTRTNRLTERLTSGHEFTRFLWGLTLDASETDRSDPNGGSARTRSFVGRNSDSSTRLAALNTEYVINQYISALADVGYDRINDNTLDDEIDSPFGDGGFAIRPGPRTSLRLVYGRRYEREYWNGQAQYLFGAKSRAIVTYTQTVQTSASVLDENLSYLGADEFGNLIDRRNAERLQIYDTNFNLTNNAFRRNRLDGRIQTALGRNTISLTGFDERRETDAIDTIQRSRGGAINFLRPITPVTRISSTLRYSNINYDTRDDRKDDIYSASFTLAHDLTETLTGTLSYTHLNRDSTESRSDLRENVVLIGLRKTF